MPRLLTAVLPLLVPLIVPLAVPLVVAACSGGPPQGETPFQPSPGMDAVLREYRAMHAVPLAGLSPAAARDVPSLADAADAIANVKGLPATVTNVPQVQHIVASGAAGALPARLFRPVLARDTPVILWFVGGTWVTGSLDRDEETARQLAARTGWVVVELRTRPAPEAPFPAAHDDAYALYQWARANMREWGADPTRVVLAGEGPGADLALSVAMQARDDSARGSRVAAPDALLLVTPWLGTSLDTPSMAENAGSRPLSRATVRWAQRQYAPDDLRSPRLDLAGRSDFGNLPPTTVVLAPIDPQRSSGETVAAGLRAAGVATDVRVFPGTTAGFFGLADVVPEAAAAEDYAVGRLTGQFARPVLPVLAGPVRAGRSAPRHGAVTRRGSRTVRPQD